MHKAARWVVIVAAIALLAAPAARAQSLGRQRLDHAFLVRLGGFFPSGDSPLWTDVEGRYTLDADDFDGTVFGMSFVTALGNEWEVGFHADFYEETQRSEERFFVDEDGFPILHDTQLESVPLTVDVRWLPGGRYRMRPGGSVVLKPVFYIGASAGLNLWEYDEVGDFVDETDPLGPSVFFGSFHESGEALQWGALAGVELPLDPMFHLVFEGRYTWADGDLESDLASLDSIDLGGPWFFVGGGFRF